MRRHLLVVEDSRTQAAALQAQLEEHGYAVSVARSGEEALERLRAGGIDLVLSDVLMPGIGGFELCRRMKRDALLRDVPLVLLTSLGDPLDIVRGLECGADNYVTKPYEVEQLVDRVARVLEHRTVRTAPDGAIRVTFLGEQFTIGSDREQILNLLISSFEELIRANDALRRSQDERARQLEREQEARSAAETTALRLRTLQAITDAALEGPEATHFLDRMLARLQEALRADVATVLLVAPDGSALVVEATRGLEEEQRTRLRVPVGKGLSGRVAATGEPLVVEDVPADADVVSPALRRHVRSYLGVPMRVEGRVLGVLHVGSSQPRRFSGEDLQLLRLVADRAALAVDRARLYQRERDARLEAEEANRAKSEFLAVMSHELRTPLNAIGGYAELMEMGIRGPVTESQREDLVRIQRNQRHLLSMINDVLNFAKIEAGHVRFEPDFVPLHELLEGIDALIVPQVHAKSLRYEYQGCDPSLRVYADREKIEQILINLLTNAIKFTEAGGRITLACTREGGAVAIRVRDTGVGIPPDRLEHIFEPFVQVDSRRTREQEGVGLGLAISRDLARAMGGDLTADSTVGEGSTFTLTLPLDRDGGQQLRPGGRSRAGAVA